MRIKRNVEQDMKISTDELLENIISDYATTKQRVIMELHRNMITREDFLRGAEELAQTRYHASGNVLQEVIKKFEQYVFAYSILTPLIEDPDISDIRCVSYDNVRVKKKGKRGTSTVRFASEEAYGRFIEFVAMKNQANISNINAIQRFTDSKSNPEFILRFTVTMPLINTYEQPYLAIRKVPKNFPEMSELIKVGLVTQEQADYIINQFRTSSVLICGGNSAGKTTFLNALKETIPHDKAVMIVQQSDELTTKNHPEMLFLHSLPTLNESAIKYDLEEISIAGLTMDVDYFIVGEVKGSEAAHLLNAAYSGQISAATVHAFSAATGIDKIIDYALKTCRYSKRELLEMMTCFKTVVFLKNYRVEQIYDVKGWSADEERIIYRPVCEGGRML